MLIFHTVQHLQKHLNLQKQKGLITGFVPTMGALHHGHLSLIEQSKQATNLTICSIFINQTQFNDPKDFEKYPVTIGSDVELLMKAGVDVLFLPSVKEIYPDGTHDQPHYDLGSLETVLEGKYRPGHFQGVCQVMYRLLSIVDAHDLFMGQKDYQQCMVIHHLIKMQQIPTKLHIAPTLRETDGLAMSSRNMRLTNEHRQTAVAISQALIQMKTQLQQGSLQKIKEEATAFLSSNGFNVDYTEIAHADSLTLLDHWNGNDPVVALIAAYIGDVRLIDNMLLTNTD
jgi:pantoate--beta-alanine ligase